MASKNEGFVATIFLFLIGGAALVGAWFYYDAKVEAIKLARCAEAKCAANRNFSSSFKINADQAVENCKNPPRSKTVERFRVHKPEDALDMCPWATTYLVSSKLLL